MLASALEPVASDQSSASQQTPSDQIVLLQSQLALAKAQIDKNVAEKQQLVNMSELLEGEIDDYRKIIDNQKKEIKRLNRDNDTMRRELSHFRGIRRYTTENSRHKSDTDDGAPSSNTTIKEELDVTKTKLISLREHIMDIAGSLLTAVDEVTHESSDPGDSDEGFQEVMSRRQRHFRLRPNPAVTGRQWPLTLRPHPRDLSICRVNPYPWSRREAFVQRHPTPTHGHTVMQSKVNVLQVPADQCTLQDNAFRQQSHQARM